MHPKILKFISDFLFLNMDSEVGYISTPEFCLGILWEEQQLYALAYHIS